MKRLHPYILRVAVGILLLFILGWLSVFAFVSSNKKWINELAIVQINKQVKGQVHIADVSTDFIRTFPFISIHFSDVTIRDSLWNVHHHDILTAQKIFVRFQLMSLFLGKPRIANVIVQDGTIYLYTDECGYRNLNRTEDLAFKKGEEEIPDFIFHRTRIVIQNETLNSFHDIDFEHLSCHILKNGSLRILNMNITALVHAVEFNLEKGSYLKEKKIKGKFSLTYNPAHTIELHEVHLTIDQHPFDLNGTINIGSNPMSYDLHIQTQNIPYRKSVSLLNSFQQGKFSPVDVMQPIDADGTLTGLMARKVIPRVVTKFSVHHTSIKTSMGLFENCTFTGTFTNQIDTTLQPGDENTKFLFNNFKGTWSGIPIASKTIEVANIKNSILKCDLQSDFALENLNQLAESSTLCFLKGTGHLDITYYGSILNNDAVPPVLNGTLRLTDAEVNYVPRNLVFTRCAGEIEFKNKDVLIQRLVATAGTTPLIMSGNVLNMMALLNLNPEQLTTEWTISTPVLNLNDFISFIGQNNEVVTQKSVGKNKSIQVAENIDRMLRDGTAKLNVTADMVTYKKFSASEVKASIRLIGNQIVLEDVTLHQGGGAFSLKGAITNGNTAKIFQIETIVRNADIPTTFRAFDNFGQDAITSKNMKGLLSAIIKVEGELTDKAGIKESSMKASVQFDIKDGELNHFEPAMKMAKVAFKNRDFSQIRFGELKNHLKIDGTAFTIPKMEIRSNRVTLFVEGVYDTRKGTDMSIQVPLSNLSRDENEDLLNTGKPGMNIRLRAKTGEDGDLKITWDPFNNAGIKRKATIKADSLPPIPNGKQYP